MIKNSSLNKSKFSSGFFSFKHGKKSKLSLYFSARFEIVTFMSERKVLYEFLQKCFKTTERHSLVVCASLCGEKHFLLIFIPFLWFDQNSCLNKSKFSSGFAHFQRWFEKQIF